LRHWSQPFARFFLELRSLQQALASFAFLSPTALPLHHVSVLLEIASRGEVTYKGLEEALGLANSTISRTVNALGSTHRKGYKGYGLIEVVRDPGEGRRMLV
jgi:DNA-binding MarR family transcriptional regulator